MLTRCVQNCVSKNFKGVRVQSVEKNPCYMSGSTILCNFAHISGSILVGGGRKKDASLRLLITAVDFKANGFTIDTL